MDNREEITFRNVLRNRSFLSLWSAQTISRLGDGVHEIAILWLVLTLTHSPITVSVALICSVLPSLVFGLFAGAIIDISDRKKLMVGSDLIRFFITLTIPIAYYLNMLQLWMIYVVAILTSIAESFFIPARQASIPYFVKEEELNTANSLDRVSLHTIQIFSFGLGGVIVAMIGAPNAFLVDAFTFLASALIVFSIKFPEHVEKGALYLKKIIDEVIYGLKFIRGKRLILLLLILLAAVNFIVIPIEVVMVILSEDLIVAGSVGFGILVASFAFGGVVGAIICGKTKLEKGKLLIYGVFGVGIGIGSIPLWPFAVNLIIELSGYNILDVSMLLLSSLSFFVVGIFSAAISIPSITLVQIHVPDEVRGRVFSANRMLTISLAPISIFVVGVLITVIGVDALLYLMGISLIALGALSRFSRTIWETN